MKKLSNNKKKMKNNSDRNNAIQPSFTEKLYYQLDCYLSGKILIKKKLKKIIYYSKSKP